MTGDSSGSSAASPCEPVRPKRLLRDLPADVFMNKLEHFSGPQVTIRVEGRDFRLPKDLLCYNSTFFDGNLNGDSGGMKLENTAFVLPDASSKDFEMVVQWMYMSNVVPPVIHPQRNEKAREAAKEVPQRPEPNSGDSPSNNSLPDMPKLPHTISNQESIAAYLRFFKMAHHLGLLGPFDLIYRRIKNMLLASEVCLLPSHVRSAAELPVGHPVRQLFAQACVMPYLTDVNVQYSRDFRFGTELNEVEAFAADLFREYDQVIRQAVTEMEGNALFIQARDPLTGKMVRTSCAYRRI